MDPFYDAFVSTMLQDLQHNENDEACMEEREPRDVDTLSDDTAERLKADCARFQSEAAADLTAAFDTGTCNGRADAGSDFYLTRVGHGAGFWDRGLGEAGERLTERVGHGTSFPSFDAYIGDDGKVYVA